MSGGRNPDVQAERVLSALPGMAGARIEAVLSDGPTNSSYRVARGGERCVLRVDKPAAARLGLDRGSEQAVIAAVAAAGIGPETVYFDAKQGVSLRRFAPGRSWIPADLADPDRLKRLAALLARLHRMPPTGRPYDPAAAAERYARQIASRQARKLSDRVKELQERVMQFEPPVALCHNDLVCENILEGDQLVLIDWEYAGPGDPFFDLAVTIQHHALDESLAKTLFEAYLGRAPTAREQERLLLQRKLYQALLDLWHLRINEP